MTRKDLYLMSGVPGSGKTTFTKSLDDSSYIISRDDIRFSLLEDGDEYFAKEDDVYKVFVDKTNNAITNENINKIYCDATFQTAKSRAKFLRKLNLEDINLHVIFVQTSLENCLKNNRKRKGFNRVRDDILKLIYERYEIPTFNEEFEYKDILTINGDIDNDMVNK